MVCGICGAEVKQEGFFLKCQNEDCRMELPIDTQEIRDAMAIGAEEVARQSPEL